MSYSYKFRGRGEYEAVVDPANVRVIRNPATGRFEKKEITMPDLPSEEKEKKAAMPDLPSGTPSFRVQFDAVIETLAGQYYATSRVRETGNGTVHYLYLDRSPSAEAARQLGLTSPSSFLGEGDTISVDFRGFSGSDSDRSNASGAPAGTTAVRTRTKNGATGFVHFLDLASPSVTVSPAYATGFVHFLDLASPVPPSAILAEADRISSTDVIARIGELKEKDTERPACLRRLNEREGQDPVLARFRTADEAEKFLEEGDYARDRLLLITTPPLSNEERSELNRLRTLQSGCVLTIGSSRWSEGVTLLAERLLGPDWARAETRAQLQLGSLDQWPFTVIDWRRAAAFLRDERYYRISVLGSDSLFCLSRT